MKKAQYTLIIKDASEVRINGTTSTRDIEVTRRLAWSILQTVQGASSVEISAYDPNGLHQPLETVTLDQEQPGSKGRSFKRGA